MYRIEVIKRGRDGLGPPVHVLARAGDVGEADRFVDELTYVLADDAAYIGIIDERTGKAVRVLERRWSDPDPANWWNVDPGDWVTAIASDVVHAASRLEHLLSRLELERAIWTHDAGWELIRTVPVLDDTEPKGYKWRMYAGTGETFSAALADLTEKTRETTLDDLAAPTTDEEE